MRNKLTSQQKLEFLVLNSKNPNDTKQNLLREKLRLIKFLMRKGASQETLDRLSREYFKFKKIH